MNCSFHFLLPLPGEPPRLHTSLLYIQKTYFRYQVLCFLASYTDLRSRHTAFKLCGKLLAAMAYPKSCPSFSNTYPSRWTPFYACSDIILKNLIRSITLHCGRCVKYPHHIQYFLFILFHHISNWQFHHCPSFLYSANTLLCRFRYFPSPFLPKNWFSFTITCPLCMTSSISPSCSSPHNRYNLLHCAYPHVSVCALSPDLKIRSHRQQQGCCGYNPYIRLQDSYTDNTISAAVWSCLSSHPQKTKCASALQLPVHRLDRL